MSRRRSMEAILQDQWVTIGELAATGLRYSTLKFYTEEGMLPFCQPESNLTRRYRRVETMERLERIGELKAQGLSIPEIQARLAE